MKRRWLTVALAALTVGCTAKANPAGTDPALTEPVTVELSAHETRAVPGTTLTLTFERVVSDSRCPLEVMCVWVGNAEVEIGTSLGEGPAVPFRLNTALDPRSFDFGAYRVTLSGVSPVPHEPGPIDPMEYRVQLLVEARPFA